MVGVVGVVAKIKNKIANIQNTIYISKKLVTVPFLFFM